MGDLDTLIGDWTVEMTFPAETGLEAMRGWTRFEWILGGAFLLQTAAADHPAVPGVHALIAGGVQHYFDSRGVVRTYAFALESGVWTLSREADPPDFHQRFRATLDGDRFAGAWERTEAGEWMHDFDITYTRA